MAGDRVWSLGSSDPAEFLTMTVRPIGSDARIGGDIDVVVAAVRIDPGPCLMYYVIWCCDGRRQTDWVCDFELEDS